MNWVVCLKNTGYEASLEARKLYNVQDDPKAMFAPIAIQNALEGQLLAA